MNVIYGFGSRKGHGGPRSAVVTVGVFDGVHRGHQEILRRVVEAARRKRFRSVAVTFSFHPTHLVQPLQKVSHISTIEQKLSYLAGAGIDLCYVVHFNRVFANLSAQRFVRDFLLRKIRMRELFVGEDFVFGKGRKGDIRFLKKSAEKFCFRLHVLRHLKVRNRVVSSTLIRHLIRRGRLDQAAAFLGRPVSLAGVVVRGEGRGRSLGFPTANLGFSEEPLLPDGVYAARAAWARQCSPGVVYIGTKPTFYKNPLRRSVEIYLFSCPKNLYGRTIEIYFKKKLRDDKTFSDPQALAAQIRRDVASARRVLKN